MEKGFERGEKVLNSLNLPKPKWSVGEKGKEKRKKKKKRR